MALEPDLFESHARLAERLRGRAGWREGETLSALDEPTAVPTREEDESGEGVLPHQAEVVERLKQQAISNGE